MPRVNKKKKKKSGSVYISVTAKYGISSLGPQERSRPSDHHQPVIRVLAFHDSSRNNARAISSLPFQTPPHHRSQNFLITSFQISAPNFFHFAISLLYLNLTKCLVEAPEVTNPLPSHNLIVIVMLFFLKKKPPCLMCFLGFFFICYDVELGFSSCP